MLAVVDHFAGSGMLIRRSTATKKGAALEQSYSKTSFGESASGSQSGQSAADDRHGG